MWFQIKKDTQERCHLPRGVICIGITRGQRWYPNADNTREIYKLYPTRAWFFTIINAGISSEDGLLYQPNKMKPSGIIYLVKSESTCGTCKIVRIKSTSKVGKQNFNNKARFNEDSQLPTHEYDSQVWHRVSAPHWGKRASARLRARKGHGWQRCTLCYSWLTDRLGAIIWSHKTLLINSWRLHNDVVWMPHIVCHWHWHPF